MATQDVEGSIAPTGDVVDFVIEIDNPTGFITPFGGVSVIVDAINGVELDGTITPVGTLIVLSPTACFPTSYTCVESNAVDYSCVGSCEADTLIVPEDLTLEGLIIPVGQLVESCPTVEACPPIIGSDCNDLLRILAEKVLAWHIASCGVLLSGGDIDGIVVQESFEDYNTLADMVANGWSFIDTMGPGPNDGSITIDSSLAYDGVKSLKMTTHGTGSYSPGTTLRATKTFGGADGLIAAEDYHVSVQGRMDARSGWDVQSTFYIIGATTTHRSITGAGVGAFMLLGPVAMVSTGLAQITVYLERVFSFVTQNRQIWWDNLLIEGPTVPGLEQWQDMSGHGNHLTRIIASVKATQNGPVLNGTVTIAFPSGAFLEWPVNLLAGTEALEAFVVVKTTNGSGLWRIGSDLADPTLFPDSVTGNLLENFGSASRLDLGAPIVDPTAAFRLYHVRTDGANLNASLNNLLQAGPLSHIYGYSQAPVFGQSAADTPGVLAVAEIILTTALTNEERTNTIAILSDRWALGLS